MNHTPKIGAHVSVAGGPHKCFENARAIGAQAIQIFGASPRQWNAPLPTKEKLEPFFELQKKNVNIPIFLHATYLANIASPNSDLRKKSIQSLIDHLFIAEKLNAVGLIYHIGSGKEQTKEDAINKVIDGMKQILKNVPGKSFLIMENTAGGGQRIGSNIEEIGSILKKAKLSRVKVCLDTAHAFESGTIDEFTPVKIKKYFDDVEKFIELKNLVALHINDSKTKAGSNHDRHENIGKGYIGLKGFKNLAKEKRIVNTPWLLEVPGFDGNGPDKKNVDIIKKLFGNA